MNLFEVLLNPEERAFGADRIYGVTIAIVTNNRDPKKLGRVKVKFPWLSDREESHWARIATLMAGNTQGTYFLPDVNDEVLVAFERGDVRFPYVLGALWNGKDKPPATNDDGKNNIRVIQSRSGHCIRLNDENGKEKIEIIDKSGNNSLVFDTGKNAIAITSSQDITLSANQGTLKLEAKTIELKSAADTQIESGAAMNLNASATMNLKGTTINLN